MSKGLVWVAAFAFVLVTGRAQDRKEGKPEVLVRWSFAGTEQLAREHELAGLQKAIQLPESTALRDAAVAKLASLFSMHFSQKGATNPNPAASGFLKGVLPDLVQAESRLELVTQGAKDADWIFAIRLPEPRAVVWNQNLAELAKLARMTVRPRANARWSADREDYHFSFSRLDDQWVVLEGGFGPKAAEAKLFKSFRGHLGKGAGKEVLKAEINFPVLGKIWSSSFLEHSPKIDLTVAPRKGALRTEATIDYPEDLRVRPEKWNIPAELIHEPIIAFTAFQGISELLAHSPFFQSLGALKTPNQAYLWELDEGPFSVYLAGDVGNPGTVVSNLVSHAPELLKSTTGGNIEVLTNRSAAFWRGLPIVVPFVEPAAPPFQSWLFAGLFPVSENSTNKAPADLFAQLRQKNLIYYDWEVSQARIAQWRPIWQLARIVQMKTIPRQDSPSEKWLGAVAPLLGNTATEVTLENSHRLKLVRRSVTGFSSLELVLLAHAMDTKETARPAASGPRKNRPRPLPPAAAPVAPRR